MKKGVFGEVVPIERPTDRRLEPMLSSHARFLHAGMAPRRTSEPAQLIKGCNIEADTASTVNGALALPTKSWSFSAHWLT
jgi:hypothetical protein